MTATEAPTRTTETIDEAAREHGDEISDETRSAADRARVAVMGAFDHVPDLFGTARSGASQVAEHLPDADADRQRPIVSVLGLAAGDPRGLGRCD
ncbi:MAG: hypothetical protein ABSE70_08580 [Candidatus Limnocylindrales bacterium]